LTEQACSRGDIDAIILIALTLSAMDLLQSCVDRTGDVQSKILTLCCYTYVCPQRVKDKKAERWLENYRDLLDGFNHRVGFDIERDQILHEAMQNGDMAQEEWAPRQITIRCHYCNKPVHNSQQPKLMRVIFHSLRLQTSDWR
jgi:WD repeat-containing protein mio